MRGRAVALLLTVCVGGAPCVWAGAEPAPAPVAAILQNLASDNFATREAAQRDLAKLSPDQIEVLRDAAAGIADPEVKARLETRIAEMVVDPFIHPKPLSISVKNATLGDFAKALNEQLGITSIRGGLSGDGVVEPTITLKVKDAPLWEILRQAHEIIPFSVSKTIAPNSSIASLATVFQLSQPYVGQAPPHLTFADGMGIQSQFAGTPTTGPWTLKCSILLDPRMRVAEYIAPIHVERAFAQDGQPLRWTAPATKSTATLNNPEPMVTVTASFAAAPGITAIRELRGTVIVEILESEKTFTIDLTKDKIDPIISSLANITVERGADEFRLTFVRHKLLPGGAPREAPFNSAPGLVSIHALDGHGKVLQSIGASSSNAKLSIKPDATTLTVTMTEKTREAILPIVLKNIPVVPGPEEPARPRMRGGGA